MKITCNTPTYDFDGWRFEYKPYLGPHPIKKNGELMKRIPAAFWLSFKNFARLPKADQRAYRVGGGCEVTT